MKIRDTFEEDLERVIGRDRDLGHLGKMVVLGCGVRWRERRETENEGADPQPVQGLHDGLLSRFANDLSPGPDYFVSPLPRAPQVAR